MDKVWCIVVAFTLLVTLTSARVDSEECKKLPKEKHCLIEWMCRARWPHTVRWVYNWRTGKCFEIRWSDHCDKVPVPTTTNNFPSEWECYNECSGWA